MFHQVHSNLVNQLDQRITDPFVQTAPNKRPAYGMRKVFVTVEITLQ